MAVPSPLGDVNIVVSYFDSFMLNAFTLKKKCDFFVFVQEAKVPVVGLLRKCELSLLAGFFRVNFADN